MHVRLMPRALADVLPSARRFPPPWTLDEANDACFIVRERAGKRSPTSTSRKGRGRSAANRLPSAPGITLNSR